MIRILALLLTLLTGNRLGENDHRAHRYLTMASIDYACFTDSECEDIDE